MGIGVALPLAYLLVRAAQSDLGHVQSLIFRARTLGLLLNTVYLTVGVLAVTTALALPAAWLVTRTNIRYRRRITIGLVLPLAIPPYLMAYALMSVGGYGGPLRTLFGIRMSPISGFFGALMALSLFNFPYMFLNLRTALKKIDPDIEEAARTLGDSPMRVFFRVVLPQLRPALSAGALLVAMRVIGDFGVVSLMRFETFSYALYQQYEAASDRAMAAVYAIILLTLAGAILYLDVRFVRGLIVHRASAQTPRRQKQMQLGAWAVPAFLFVAAIILAGVVMPVGAIGFWFIRGLSAGALEGLTAALVGSVGAALPAAVLAVLLAVPVAYLEQRYPSRFSAVCQRAAYLGYATPCLAFGLGVIFFVLVLTRVFPGLSWLYQSLGVMIYAYSLHFLAEALSPLRSCLALATPQLEEASRTLGETPWRTFLRVTLPLLRPGLFGGMILVFLSAMKELPLTFLLRPNDYETLAYSAWDMADDGLFAEAAPFALVILITSCALVAAMLYFGREKIS